MKNRTTYLAIALICLGAMIYPKTSAAQVSPHHYDYPHNHLDWYTIESSYFLIHFQEGNEEPAMRTAEIADRIYTPITDLYGYSPDRKISIILHDREDYSNGAAYFFDDKIEIWLPPLDTPLRGTHRWLENVITHEFVHMVQLGASMKRSIRIPAIYLQWLSYEEVRRPDVLYGFPRGLITLPFATVAIPAWFAEGTAQYQREGMEFDYWDSHRDMVLRTRILSGTHLSFTEMGTFSSKTGLEREVAYNQGFAFTAYLAHRFGEEILADITREASRSGSGNFSRVIERVTGISGENLFDDWIREKEAEYRQMTAGIPDIEPELVEEEGYFNFYPQYSPDRQQFAYLTNRQRDYGRTYLLVQDGGENIVIDELNGMDRLGGDRQYMMAHGQSSNAVLDFVSNRFSFSPKGDQLLYNRSRINRHGEAYQDLYLYNLETATRTRLTHSQRIQDPAWHPFKPKAAAVQLHNGTQNLVLVSLDRAEIEPLTQFENFETVYTPIWHPDGSAIIFAAAADGNRNLYAYHPDEGTITVLFQDHYIDFRDPWVDPEGEYLYFSSDRDGIFNIFRYQLDTGQTEQITNLSGGAFMPFVRDSLLYYASYRSDGYKIERTEIRPVSSEQFAPGSHTTQPDIGRSPSAYATADRPESVYEIVPYSQTTTGLSVFPVIRFDNYSRIHGSYGRLIRDGNAGLLGESLWRDMKLGAYFSSRDVTERISLFGGALIGPGSKPADGLGDFFNPARVNSLDRDLFFIAEHRGLPFIQRSWSPTVSLEIYNLKRNVRNGLEFEEFPCTACLPETRQIDIRYSIWEAGLFLRSKINSWNMAELGITHSPYSVSSDGFFSEEYGEFIAGSTSEYFRGTTLSAGWYSDLTEPARHSDIAFRGVRSSLVYRYQPGRLLDRFDLDDGTLRPVYEREQNHSFEFNGRAGMGVGSASSFMLTSRAFAYLNRPDNHFYLDYTGGLTGLRSYPFFAIGGQRTAFLRSSFISPIWNGIDRQAGVYTLDKLFLHLYTEAGNGWGGPLDIGDNLKFGLGAELRFAFNNSYLFPMKFFMNTSYGLNRFDVTLPSQFITPGDTGRVGYGQELLFYFGLTFDFDQI
jgi:hypothetical protein